MKEKRKKHKSHEHSEKSPNVKLSDIKVTSSMYGAPAQEVRYKIDISWTSIIKVLLTVSAIYFGFRLIQVGLVLLFAFILSSALLPTVRWFERRGYKRGIGILSAYLMTFVLFLVVSIMVIVPFTRELQNINQDLPTVVENTIDTVADGVTSLPFVDISRAQVREKLLEIYQEQVSDDTDLLTRGLNGALKTVQTISDVGGIFGSIFVTVVLSIYIVADHDNFIDLLSLRINDERRRNLVKERIQHLENRLGSWLVGQGALSLIIGGCSWVILTLFDVPFALPLAVFAGVMESIPSMGPFLAAVPAVILAYLSGGTFVGTAVMIGYLLLQQLENTFLVPKIMGNVVGVKPIVVMIGILVGFSLAGVIGAIVTIPVLVILKIGYEFYVSLQKLNGSEK